MVARADIQDEECKAMLLDHVQLMLQRRQELEADNEQEMSPYFEQTLDYCRRFAQYKNPKSIASVLGVVERQNSVLDKYESTKLANLCPVDVDAAKELLPSLKKERGEGGVVDDDYLQTVLQELSQYREFQGHDGADMGEAL